MATVWDPLRKTDMALTPEEEVRQWIIAVLRDSFAFPEHLMMSEAGFSFGSKKYRADVLVYDRQGQPLCIVECKRPDVPITKQVAEQAMRYNAVLSVRYIILTNGKDTRVYMRQNDVFVPIQNLPSYTQMIR